MKKDSQEGGEAGRIVAWPRVRRWAARARSVTLALVAACAIGVACGGARPTAEPHAARAELRCARARCEGVGQCDALLGGWIWTGERPARCELFRESGCYLRGPTCAVYPSLDACEAAHADCP